MIPSPMFFVQQMLSSLTKAVSSVRPATTKMPTLLPILWSHSEWFFFIGTQLTVSDNMIDFPRHINTYNSNVFVSSPWHAIFENVHFQYKLLNLVCNFQVPKNSSSSHGMFPFFDTSNDIKNRMQFRYVVHCKLPTFCKFAEFNGTIRNLHQHRPHVNCFSTSKLKKHDLRFIEPSLVVGCRKEWLLISILQLQNTYQNKNSHTHYHGF